jgi:hypothetical protein
MVSMKTAMERFAASISLKRRPSTSSVLRVFMKLSALAFVVGIAGPAHADGDVVIGEALAIFGRGVLGGFKRSSQHQLFYS